MNVVLETLLWLWTWQCLRVTVCNCPSALKSSHCHNTHLLWLCREITWKEIFCTWEQTWDISWSPRSRAAHMLGMGEQEPACTSEALAGLSKGALLHGLARNYFRLPHRIGHGQRWTWIFPATIITEFCLVFLLHPLTHLSMVLGI